MNEEELLKKFAKALGAEEKLEEIEQKKIQQEKMLKGMAKLLGTESLLEEIEQKKANEQALIDEKREKERKMLESMNAALARLVNNNPEHAEAIQQEVEETIVAVAQEEPITIEAVAIEEEEVVVAENAAQPQPELPKDDIITQTVKNISKAAPGEIQQKVDALPPGIRKELDILKKSIADLHRFATNHSQLGGGGAVLLNDLDDVSRSSVIGATDGQVLTYNDATGKWIAATPSSGGAVSNTASLFAYVTNDEDVTVHKGDPVFLYRATGNRPSVKLAYNTGDATSAKTMGLAAEDITAHNPGWVQVRGVLTGIDTSAYSEGDTLYLGATAGTLTSTKPYAPNHLVYIGVVVRANQGQGQIYIQPQNGYELDEIHDVNINHNVVLANGHTLVWNSSNSLWENQSLSGLVATLTANNANYLDGYHGNQYAFANTLTLYQTTAGLSANVATLTANAAGYLNGKTESNLNVNNALTANASTYLNGKTESNLNVNNALTSNNASYLGGIAAAQYAYSNSLSSYLTITGVNTSNGNFTYYSSASNTAFSIVLTPYAPIGNQTFTFYSSGSIFGPQATMSWPDGTLQRTAWTGVATGLFANASGTYVNTSYIATLDANNASYLGGTVASGYQTTAGLSANVATLTANAAGYLNGKTESNLNVNNALTANASTYLNGKTESNLNVNNSLTSNNSSYLGGIAAAQYAYANQVGSTSSPVRQVFTGDGACTTFTVTGGYVANQVDVFVGGVKVVNNTDANVQSGSTIVFTTAPLTGSVIDVIGVQSYTTSSLVTNTYFQTTIADYQTTAGLSANVATLSSNNASYLGTVAAASYVQNTDSRTLSGNLYLTAANTVISTLKVVNNLTVNGEISVTGSAWTTYTPTWTSSGTQPSLGNGTLTGRYKQIGKTVFVRVSLTLGTTTTTGTGNWRFALPVNAIDSQAVVMPATYLDSGINWHFGQVNTQYDGNTAWVVPLINPNGAVSSSGPFTWGAADSLTFNGSYEAA